MSCVIFKLLNFSIIKAFSNQFYQADLVCMIYFKKDGTMHLHSETIALNPSPPSHGRLVVWQSSTPQLELLNDLLVGSMRRSVPRLGTNRLCDGSPGQHLWCLCCCKCCSGFSFSCFKDWPWQWQRQPMI